jgi:threonine dehydrogenase-like Zn-dependent dehydrogenase
VTAHATALVQTAPEKFDFRELPFPDPLPPGAAIIRVEACGICASDIDAFEGTDIDIARMGDRRFPRITGHEIVGVVERLGPPTKLRSGLQEGDRVGIGPKVSCGACEACLRGEMTHCTGFEYPQPSYGFIPTWVEPGLWGGYSTHVYAHPRTALYPFDADVDPLDATLWNALGGGIQWAVRNTGTTLGSTVAILGSGQRGLACAVAARAAGASQVVVTGLTRDEHKLALAREFGVDAAVDVEKESIVDIGRELTGDRGFDVVVDTTPLASQPLIDAVEIVRPGGVISTVGIKLSGVSDFPIDRVTTKGLTIVGGKPATHEAYAQAAAFIQEGRFPIGRMRTHVFGFDRLPEAIATLRGDDPSRKAINVVVTPTMS